MRGGCRHPDRLRRYAVGEADVDVVMAAKTMRMHRAARVQRQNQSPPHYDRRYRSPRQ